MSESRARAKPRLVSALTPRILTMILAIGALGLTVARADPQASAEPVADVTALADGLIARMKSVSARTRDATFTFYKQEWVDGRMAPEEQMFVKQRYSGGLYMRWDGEVKHGRQILYKPGWNESRMRVDPGPMLPNLDLDPRGAIARDGERHSIFEVGPVVVTRLIAADAALLDANPALTVNITDLGTMTVYGEAARCLDMALPKAREPRLYATRVIVCANTRTGLPARIEAWNNESGALRVVERYGFSGLKLNVGLTDQDFSPDHPDYGF